MKMVSWKREHKFLRHFCLFGSRGWCLRLVILFGAFYISSGLLNRILPSYRQRASLIFNATGHNVFSDDASLSIQDVLNYDPLNEEEKPATLIEDPPKQTFSWEVPESIHNIYSMEKGSEKGDYYSNYSMLNPLVYFGYAVPLANPPGHHHLYIYSSGVSIGNFERGFDVVGCLVGNEVHPVDFSHYDGTRCFVSRPIKAGERVSIVLRKDKKLAEALKGPVDLGRGAIAELNDGDVNELPPDTTIHLEEDVKPSDLMYIRTQEGATVESRVREEMPKKPRYEFCAATQMMMYPYLLEDWVDYHRRIGVDMFYILDNNAFSDIGDIFKERADVEVMYWPWERSQIQAFSYFLHMARSRCEWILLFDGDEWVMVGIGKNDERAGEKPLKQYVHRHKKGLYGVEFRFMIMGSSGVVKIPKEPIPGVYTYLGTKTDSRHGKVVVRTDVDYTFSGLHWVHVCGNRTLIYRTPVDFNKYPVTLDDHASLVHFRFRSFEEAELRWNAKSANFGDNRDLTSPGAGTEKKLPGNWKAVNESLRYTYFRDMWRSITKSNGLDEQTLVRRNGKERCVVICQIERDERNCGDEICEVVPKDDQV